MRDIILLSMPFSPVTAPSLGLGQLVASARQEGLDVEAIYANLEFFKALGTTTYEFLADGIPPQKLVAEWVFSGAAFRGSCHEPFQNPSFFLDQNHYLEHFLFPDHEDEREAFRAFCMDRIMEVRDQVEGPLDSVSGDLLGGGPKIVGCTSSFGQSCSSLAILRRIKKMVPSVATMLGGANVEGEMDLVIKKNCSWIDFVVSGEADLLFPDLAEKRFTMALRSRWKRSLRGRNDPCPCGSGKKSKKCCGAGGSWN